MREPVLDAAVLRAVAFGPGGLPRLLTALAAPAARVPPEVYDGAVALTPPAVGGPGPSTLGRDLQALERRADRIHWARAQREREALRHAARLPDHVADGALIIDPLWPEELPRREDLRSRYGIGRGEAASLVLAQRYGAQAVYLSEDGVACRAARLEGIRHVAIRIAAAA